MNTAVCFRCGSHKTGAFASCGGCGSSPRTEDELLLSLVLCDHVSSSSQLFLFVYEIKNGLRLTVPESLLVRARETLQDPELIAMLGAKRPATQPASRDIRESNTPQQTRQIGSSSPEIHNPKRTALHRNAFWLLGATTRDDRRRIVELAEEKSLEFDHDACQKARSDLTSPRTRLGFEMAWLPGVSPTEATQLAGRVLEDPMSIRTEAGLPPLAHANLMAASFEAVDVDDKAQEVADFIREMAWLVDDVSVDEVMRVINEDRAVSGFPEIKSTDQVEAELAERKRYFRNTIRDALNRLPSSSLVDVMTLTVNGATASGKNHAPELIDELVDSYEMDTQSFLQEEAENVRKLIAAARKAAKSSEGAVKPLIDKLEVVAHNWDKVAQPIQLSARARGIDHRPSYELAFAIRKLAVDLYNQHQMLVHSRRITGFLQALFSEIPIVLEQAEQDASALEEIARDIQDSETQRKEWAREISFSAEIGAMLKSTLSISPAGISWKNQTFPLPSITRVRWGAIRHSVNGIPTGTTYTIAFGDSLTEAIVNLRRREVFSIFVDKLWRAVGIRVLTELLQSLKAGKEVRFGDTLIRDDAVILTKHRLWGSNESVRCGWYQTRVWTADGAFYISAKDDKKTYGALSYIDLPNVHVLEQAIRMAFDVPGMRCLSDVLSAA